MDNFFRRWFGRSSGSAAAPTGDSPSVPAAASKAELDGHAAAAWAAAGGARFARSRDGSGFVVEPPEGSPHGLQRLEWGTPQRPYFGGSELRLRGEVPGARDLQMLVVTRTLMAALERAVFEEFTQSNETRIDDQTPEEMRWLVLYPKLPRSVMGPVGEHHAALSNLPNAAAVWLEGGFGDALQAAGNWLPPERLLIVTVHRQRISLRCEFEAPDARVLDAAVSLFDAARAAALRVAGEVQAGRVGSERPSRWDAPSVMPGNEGSGR